MIQGSNLLAVEVHQCDPTSSDLGFDLQLLGKSFPMLTQLTTTNGLQFAWAGALPGWELYTTSELKRSNTVWLRVETPITMSNGASAAQITAPNLGTKADRFFMLRNPLQNPKQ